MGVSRTTVTGIYERARSKVADSLVNGKRLCIEGGNVAFPPCGSADFKFVSNPKKKGALMRVAVTYENGEIFQHFGRTQAFKLYDIEDGQVVAMQVVDTQGSGHGALAAFLKGNDVDVLLCGGIGGGAQSALAAQGIELYGGLSGLADDAVSCLLTGILEKSAMPVCDHHGHSHGGCLHGHHSMRMGNVRVTHKFMVSVRGTATNTVHVATVATAINAFALRNVGLADGNVASLICFQLR